MANFVQCDFETNHIPHCFTQQDGRGFVCPGRNHQTWQDKGRESAPLVLALLAIAVMLAWAPAVGVCT